MNKEKTKFFSLANDTTFKYLFKNPKTRPFFEELIKYYIGLDISGFNFIDNELNSGNNYIDYRLDSVLINKEESIILNIEMNRNYKNYVDVRNRRYLHRIAGTSKDNKYNDKKVVIQLNFNCYESKEDENICTSTYMLKDEENDLTIEDFKIHNIYIPKEKEMCYNEDIKKKLKLFLCNNYKEMRKISENNEEMNIIVDELERLNQEKYFGALYDAKEDQEMLENSARYEGYEEGFELGQKRGEEVGMLQGIEKGIEQGSLSKTKEIATTLLQKDIDINMISECTGLSLEELQEIQKSM